MQGLVLVASQVVGMTNRSPHFFTYGHIHLLLMGSPGRPERKCKHVQGYIVNIHLKCFQFVIFFKGRKGIFLQTLILLWLNNWEPKQNSQTARITKLFNL